MKYVTPQIVDVTPAARVIQSSQEDKGVQTMLDSHTYEADE
jgi:hypothetical protein